MGGGAARLGHDVSTVAGSGTADRLSPGLAADATSPPSFAELSGRSRAPRPRHRREPGVAAAQRRRARGPLRRVGGPTALFHHHDLPWQRAHLAHLEGPRDEPAWRHVTINELSRRELHERGISATVVYNSFDCSPPPGRRDLDATGSATSTRNCSSRCRRGPSRARTSRGRWRSCERLDAVLWIMGPAEDGYGEELERLLRRLARHGAPPAPRRRHDDRRLRGGGPRRDALDLGGVRQPGARVRDPSSAPRAQPLPRGARDHSPSASSSSNSTTWAVIKRFLERPDEELFDANLEIARRHFNLQHLAARLERLVG